MALQTQVRADVVALDHAGIGGLANHRRVLNIIRDVAEWAVILEDDAIPCANFHTHLAAALANPPAPIVSFYLGTGRWAGTVPRIHEPIIRALIEKADEEQAEWIETQALWHGVGYAIRGDLLPGLLEHLETSRQAIDAAITTWAKAHIHPIAYTWPSLVDHRDEERQVQRGDIPVPRHAWRVHV